MVLERDGIMKIIPHRDGMLLIDRAETDGETATARYTVRGDEFFLKGHFPGNPVVPGVMLCEMMGQSSSILFADKGPFTPYFTGINKVKFKEMVRPGDTVTFKSRIEKFRGNFYFIKSEGYVGEKLAVRGELSFAVFR